MASNSDYLLDTDLCVALLRTALADESPLWWTFDATRGRVSTITIAELEVGVHKAANPAKQRRLVDLLLSKLEILPFDEAACRHYGEIRAQLEKKGKTIGPMDLLIAAHARSLGATLITSNTREFRRVPGLKCIDWKGGRRG